MSKPDLYMHIGLPKTGTTLMQDKVFRCIDELVPIVDKKSRILDGGRERGVIAPVFQRSPGIWRDLGLDLFDDIFGEYVNKIFKTEKKVILSDEEVMGGVIMPSEYRGSRWNRKARDPYKIGIHLEEMLDTAHAWGFSNIKVILVIRRQDTWLASLYAQISDRIDRPSQDNFVKQIDHILCESKGYYEHGVKLDYHLVHEILTNKVGTHNVCIVPYELLKDKPTKFINKWLDFLEIKGICHRNTINVDTLRSKNKRSQSESSWNIRMYNTSIYTYYNRILHTLNYYIKSMLGINNERIFLTKGISEKVMNVFSNSNKKLENKDAIGLDRYNYY